MALGRKGGIARAAACQLIERFQIAAKGARTRWKGKS